MSSPSEELVKAARARRAQLLQEVEWLDTAAVSLRHGGSEGEVEAEALVSRLRQSSQLLGVWSGSQFLHPPFQFDPQSGRLRPEMRDLLELMPRKQTEWQWVYWAYAPQPDLAGACPADVFCTDPERVLALAKAQFKVE